MRKKHLLSFFTLCLSFLLFLNINLGFVGAQFIDISEPASNGDYNNPPDPSDGDTFTGVSGMEYTYDEFDTPQDDGFGNTVEGQWVPTGGGHHDDHRRKRRKCKYYYKHCASGMCVRACAGDQPVADQCVVDADCGTGEGLSIVLFGKYIGRCENNQCQPDMIGLFNSTPSECNTNADCGGTPPPGSTPTSTPPTTPPQGDSCGGACDCCPGDYHYEQEEYTDKNGKVRIRVIKVCDSDRRCKQYTCHWKECSGCCCVSRSRTYTVDCGDSCPCPSSTCSSNCDCCQKGSCYPRVFLNIDPPKLFVNQSFNLSYEAEGDSCCGGLRCTVTSTYQGFNCGQSGMIGICPSDAQGINVCDPKNQLRSLTSSSGRATITTHSQYWGNCLYKVTCTNSCGNSSSATQTVMTVPVPLWGEESPISNLFSPLKPFISLFSL